MAEPTLIERLRDCARDLRLFRKAMSNFGYVHSGDMPAMSDTLDDIAAALERHSLPGGAGWIEWGGGKRPVPAHVEVEVRYWADGVVTESRGEAGTFVWRVNNKSADATGLDKDGDIIAYRLAASPPPPSVWMDIDTAKKKNL